MSLLYITKDVTAVERGVVAHGVNCAGVMNSGVARAIRNKWPVVYERFLRHPKGKQVLGEADIIHIPDEELIVVNCYTQVFYGYGGGKYADANAIEKSMNRVMQIANLMEYPVYIPRIGCGLGGLKWEKDVEPMLKGLTEDYERINIFVCDLENNNECPATRS